MIGLSLPVAILMGGHIHVNSVVGRGTAFNFDLVLPIVESKLTQKKLVQQEGKNE